MNTVMIKSIYVILIAGLITFGSCSLLDDDDPVQPPSVTYSETTLHATFFQAGKSLAPEINWNGNQGSFSLSTPVSGLSVNTTTGVLNWTKDLPLGTHDVEIVVANNTGQKIVNITLNNPLQGIFTGTITTTTSPGLPFELEFYPDGNLSGFFVRDEISFTGTWTRSGSTIQVNYTYDDESPSLSGNQVSLKGIIEIGIQPVYTGEWHHGHNQASDPRGSFEVTLN